MCVFGGGGSNSRAPSNTAPAPTQAAKPKTPSTTNLKTQRAVEKERMGVSFEKFGIAAAQRTGADGAVVNKKYVKAPAARGQLMAAGTGVVF